MPAPPGCSRRSPATSSSPSPGAASAAAPQSPPADTLAAVAHVWTRLAGHGSVVVPHAGYRIERVADAAEMTLRIARGAESRAIDLTAPIDEAAAALADVSVGSARGAWRIETDLFRCAWPHGFALVDDPDGVSRFLLVGPNDSMLWISGPLAAARATPIEKLVDDGQTVRAVAQREADARIDLDYTFDDEAWWQRRYAIVWSPSSVLVVTAQARRADEELVRAAVDLVAGSIAHTDATDSR